MTENIDFVHDSCRTFLESFSFEGLVEPERKTTSEGEPACSVRLR